MRVIQLNKYNEPSSSFNSPLAYIVCSTQFVTSLFLCFNDKKFDTLQAREQLVFRTWFVVDCESTRSILFSHTKSRCFFLNFFFLSPKLTSYEAVLISSVSHKSRVMEKNLNEIVVRSNYVFILITAGYLIIFRFSTLTSLSCAVRCRSSSPEIIFSYTFFIHCLLHNNTVNHKHVD